MMRRTVARPIARSLEVFRPMQALEDTKEFMDVLHVEADAVVAHVDQDLAIDALLAQFDDSGVSRATCT